MVPAWFMVALPVALLFALILFWQLRSPGPGGQVAHPPGHPYPTPGELWVKSKGEQQIAAWLLRNEIAFTYEPELSGGLTPDFHLDGTDVVIEYWGMAGQPSYEERMTEKLTQYEEHGYQVISLFPAHIKKLSHLDEALTREFDEHLDRW